MDFDDAKENIQPLAQGRNASILHASLNVESPQELLVQRKVYEKEIHDYSGDDPLSVWYNYIEWIEQSFPSGGKESGLQEVLSKCLAKFESDEIYKQDRRMIKLYIKFIDSHKDPAECYQQLFNAGIGTMVADFYMAWAYWYDLAGNTRKADEIFCRGIACRAQPLEELQEARQHYGFSVAQRLIYKDDDPIREETNRQLLERRMALTSLRGHRRKQVVASIRTGAAVKSVTPGTVKIDLPSTSHQRGNARVEVFKDENESPNILSTHPENTNVANEDGKSIFLSIIDAARNQENQKEPGPWNRAHMRKKGKLFSKTTVANELGFQIHMDDQDDGAISTNEEVKKPCVPPIPIAEHAIKFDKPFIYVSNFCASTKPIKGWITPVTTEEMPDKNSIPEYNKCKLYPRPNMEFQPEELKAYYILKKRGIQNKFTKERDVYWGCGPEYNIRLYPHFAMKSNPQKRDAIDETYIPENLPGLKVAFNEIYNEKDKVERQFEEILALRIKRNETIITTTDMEETMCLTSDKIQRRKSFFPIRKSLAPSAFKASSKMPAVSEQTEKEENSKVSSPITGSPSSPVVAKAAEPKNYNHGATSQILNIQSSSLKRTYFEEESQNPSEQLQTNVNPEKVQPVLSKPFEIFKDESALEIKSNKTPFSAIKPLVSDISDFQFKAPALPITNSVTVAGASDQIPLEIFDDENLMQKSPKSIPKPDFSCGTGAIFEPEETCSTQTFNIFLKAQSASTPKAITKLQPQRQFGNILKDLTTPPLVEQRDEPADNQNCVVGAAPVVAYSPPRQQLSTILEISEHGNTQGTHTTGATTKSTISSPEFDVDSQVQMTTNCSPYQPQHVLETVKELSCETSVISPSQQSVNKMINTFKILNVTDTNASKPQTPMATPGAMRLKKKGTGTGLDFSIFEDSMEKNEKKVGNFSRLEEKEDTAAGAAFKALPPIRFQDDKTETIPKMLMTTQQVKYQDDNTQTISKMIFAPPVAVQFQEDKTETISNILLGPPKVSNFPEDKTETISKFILTPPGPPKSKDKKIEVKVTTENLLAEPMNQDDSFEFFGHSPPKATKQFITKQAEKGHLSQIRTAADSRTPLTFNSKRFCEKKTPDIQKDRLHPAMKSVNEQSSRLKNNLKDSFLADFSLIEDAQPTQTKVKPESKSVFSDSFIPDFSIIEGSQILSKQFPTKNSQKTINESILPEFSIIKNAQHKMGESEKANLRNVSLLSDLSHIPETQSNESVIRSQTIEPRLLKQTSMKCTLKTSQNDISKEDLSKNIVDDNIYWQQTPNPKTNSIRKQDSTHLKSILMDTFMKGFSEINEPPPIPKDKGTIMIQLSKNNSTLRFLNESEKQKPETAGNLHQNNSKTEDISNTSKETRLRFLSPLPKADLKSPNLKNILMDTFIKGFSKINEPPPIPNDTKDITMEQPNKTTSTIRFLNESVNKKPQNARNLHENDSKIVNISTTSKETILSKEKKRSNSSDDNKYFELNCETDMFGTDISTIKNSTWLPNHGPLVMSNAKQLSEKSLHIRATEITSNSTSTSSLKSPPEVLQTENSTKPKLSFIDRSLSNNDFSIEISASESAAIKAKKLPTKSDKPIEILESPELNDDECEMSIYHKQTPKTPKPRVHIWDDADAYRTSAQNNYVHAEPDLNQTQQIIKNICIDPNVNPFNVDLIHAFLEQHYVISYLESLPTCKLVGSVQRLKQHSKININDVNFEVMKLIGEGAYGAVFCGKESSSGKLVAMKQERPPNYWEYYICLEIQERIKSDEMLLAYMSVDYALIGNNSSILVSKFSAFGSLIKVCNKIKKHTMKNVDEYVVLLLASELLEIMDHLHAVNIIHADVKADNFLLMNKLTYPPTERSLQLIDFGVSIDMKLFKEGQTFSFVHNDNSFKCPEMREQRPWTYQLDLFGLASVFHVLLFGKYMEIEKNERGFWMHKTYVPRYLNKNLWDEIFKNLLNIRDCNTMPNLQDLRALLKKEMEEKDKYVIKMVNEFNRALFI